MQELPADRVAELAELAATFAGLRGGLLPLLHAVQARIGHVPDEAVPVIAHALNLSRAEVHGVLTFYHDFARKPKGQHVVKLCRAEACQARGSAAVEAALVRSLGIAMGETRGDGAVTLEPVYCLGLCAIGPAALIDGEPVAALDRENAAQIAAELLQ